MKKSGNKENGGKCIKSNSVIRKDHKNRIFKIKFIRNLGIVAIMVTTIVFNIYLISQVYSYENDTIKSYIFMGITGIKMLIGNSIALFFINKMYCETHEFIVKCQENYEKCINSFIDTGKD